MSEQLERQLQKRADQAGLLLTDPPKPSPDMALLTEAADTLKRYREALERIANHSPSVSHGWADAVRHEARQALSDS